jgi:hypothetical protein
MKRWRWWAERGVVVASAFALLATSKAKGWTIHTSITGPTKPATPAKALALSIESSHDVTVYSMSLPPTYGRGKEAPCLETFVAGAKRTCLLPPGATADGVEVHGPCSGGCNDPCSTPPSAYGKVESKEVDVSIDGETKTMPASLPSHGKGFIASRFEVKASGSSFIEAHLSIVPRGGGKSLFDENQACELDITSKHAVCTYTVYDSMLGSVHDVDVTVEATGWDECTAPGCTPPKTFHIDSVKVMP